MATDFGADMSCTQCNAVLPFPTGIGSTELRTVNAVQLTLGFATDQRPGAPPGTVLPAVATGRANVGEALIRRLTCARGTLIDVITPPSPGCANYGTDLTAFLNADVTARQLGMIGAAVNAECLKDERVFRCETKATMVGDLLIVDIAVVTATGPFKLVLAISQVSVAVLSVPS